MRWRAWARLDVLLALALATAAHCGPVPASSSCAPAASRCNGNKVEVCDADHSWQTSLDCAEVTANSGSTFTCQTDATEGSTCKAAPP